MEDCKFLNKAIHVEKQREKTQYIISKLYIQLAIKQTNQDIYYAIINSTKTEWNFFI